MANHGQLGDWRGIGAVELSVAANVSCSSTERSHGEATQRHHHAILASLSRYWSDGLCIVYAANDFAAGNDRRALRIRPGVVCGGGQTVLFRDHSSRGD